jgi:hypothetical protein
MSKSKAEIARLQLNAQAQAVLTQHHIKKVGGETKQPIATSNDIYEPAGEIDFTHYKEFVRDEKNVKKKSK